MYLRKITTVGTQLLPDVWCGIKSYNINTVITQVQHVSSHVIEHNRISVVEIPLVWIKGSHHHLMNRLAPGEIAGCRSRENLWYGFFKSVGNIPVIVEEISVLVLLLTISCTTGPLMIFRSVIHNEIHAHTHSVPVALFRKFLQIFHGSQFRLYPAEIRNRISAVRTSLRALEKRHKMNIV